MTIKQVVDMVMKENSKIKIRIEMLNGMKGREFIYNKENIYKFISGWENYEVLDFTYQKVITSLGYIKVLEEPYLYILYKA